MEYYPQISPVLCSRRYQVWIHHYNVLAGLLLRDLFPDPKVLCRYLDKHEIGEINKFRIQDGIVLDIAKISPDFQFKAQEPERVGYWESLGENVAADEEIALADKEDHAVYRRTDEFRKTDDFKKTDELRKIDEFRKTDDFKKTDELRKIDDFKRADKFRNTDDFKRTDDNPDRIENFRRTEEISWFEEEISWFDESSWIGKISWSWEISWS